MSFTSTDSKPAKRRAADRSWATTLAAGLNGLLAGGITLGVGHLVAAVIAPAASPLLAVGSTFIDLTPEWLKSFAIATFGESDKVALLGGLAITFALLAVGIGLVSIRHARGAIAAVAVFGVAGALAAFARPAAGVASVLPTIIGAASGIVALAWLGTNAESVASRPPQADGSRRRFLAAAVVVGVVGASSGVLGVVVTRWRAAAALRDRPGKVPIPLDPGPTIPEGADLRIPGVTPFVTANDAFYRVDTALEIPVVDVDAWRLRVHGMVERDVELTYSELLELPTIERDITLTCVSNQVGGRYVGNARWIGVPLATILELAGPGPDADQIVSTSVDGMTIGTPTAVALDGRDAMLAVAMNGALLPPVHGYPVRMVVPGLYGYVSATKWLVDLELTTFGSYDPYWVQRGWAAEAPIKTMSRIDVPKPLARLQSGRVAIAGVAWAQHRGVERVEVRIDGGGWMAARLADTDSIDTWRQWVYQWDAVPGNHALEVRAVDSTGVIQTDVRAEPFPSGATGWHSIVVTVT